MFWARLRLLADVTHVIAVACAILVAIGLRLVGIADRRFAGAEAPVHADGCTRRRLDVLVPGRRCRALDGKARAMHAVARLDHDRDPEAALDLGYERTLVVQDVESHRRARRNRERGRLLHQMVLDGTHYDERNRFRRADVAGALAMRALRSRALDDAGAQALARHLEQAEVRDAANLDAGAVVAQRVLHTALDGAVVALFLHVDEVDDDEAGEVAQLQLARDFFGGFDIGVKCCLLDRELARRLARVDVDGDERLGLIDDDVTAGAQRHHGVEHGAQLPLDAEAREQWLGCIVADDSVLVAGHQHAHEVAGLVVGTFAGNLDVVDVFRVEIADRSLDQVAFLINEAGRRRCQRHIPHALPETQQVFVIALDLLLRLGSTCRADDQPHAFGDIEVLRDGLETLPVRSLCNLARDATAAAGVRHQHGVAASQRDVGRKGRALVAAFFLDDLDQDDLAALDHFLDLVLARTAAWTLGQFLERVLDGCDLVDLVVGLVVALIAGTVVGAAAIGAADLLDVAVIDAATLVVIVAAVITGCLGGIAKIAVVGRPRSVEAVVRVGAMAVDVMVPSAFRWCVGAGCVRLPARRIEILPDHVAAMRRVAQCLGTRRFAAVNVVVAAAVVPTFAMDTVTVAGIVACVEAMRPLSGVVVRRARLTATVVAAISATIAGTIAAFTTTTATTLLPLPRPLVGLGFRGGFRLGFLLLQEFAIRDRDLVVIRMDLVEGEKAVAIAAVLDESRLEGGLHSCDLGEIDVAAEQFARRRLEIELFYPAIPQYHHPGLLRVGGIDKHFVLVHGIVLARRAASAIGPDRRPAIARSGVETRCCVDGVGGVERLKPDRTGITLARALLSQQVGAVRPS